MWISRLVQLVVQVQCKRLVVSSLINTITTE
ncbi:Pectin lyase-like superfamily protein [Zea mays]|uniref:Pectin lyase-like superfamily protein n=1 Tax=Zea mays TaxID=4577 RepID=A0A1D6LJI8_MAIZE|nr:Pectin lyase-like superfamily protein [Zea mays]